MPLATHTGWNEYRAPYPTGEIADRDGSCLAFAATRTDREASGDPRLSLQERYPARDAYVAAVGAAVDTLVRERFVLPEDARAYVERARVDPRLKS